MTDTLPKKLKNDAILEAILEIRFEPDPSLLPEIIFGRFADSDVWKDFKQARLPTADIPAPIRRIDPNLRYQPSIELVSPDGLISVRVGPQVVAYSRRGSYPGWDIFGMELAELADHLYRAIPKANVNRIGLRYVNALKSDLHGINDVNDMALSITVAGERLSQSLNLNFRNNVGTSIETMSRIASVDLAEGSIPENATVIVDIDVYTGHSFTAKNPDEVKQWVRIAHKAEKECFFKALGKEATDRLREV